MNVYQNIIESAQKGEKLIARLLDPDNFRSVDEVIDEVSSGDNRKVDLFFIGGSLITQNPDFDVTTVVKKATHKPVILFPSTPQQISGQADAILFLSLISGRNPEYLIGHHVTAAPLLRNSKVEVIPTGYMLVSCGSITTAEYISNSTPLPREKPEVAAATALAGEMLGLKLLYLDAGSGASQTILPEMVRRVKEWTTLPLIVGGGIRNASDARALLEAGADVLVTGNGADWDPKLISELVAIKRS